MNLVITITICILLAFLFNFLSKKLRLPVIVGLIILGLIIGSPLVRNVLLVPNTDFILQLANLGLLFLMFLAGLEVSWSLLYKERKEAVLLASFAAVTPFLLGFIVFILLGFPLLVSLVVGICMSITAEATKARVLLELKKLKTKLGALMMGAGIVDDIFGIVLITLIAYLFGKLAFNIESVLLISSILAFFVGIVVHKIIGRTTRKIQYLENFLLFFIVPFFFIGMGIHFSFQSLILEPLLLLIVISVAIIGKLLGSLLTKPFIKLRLKQLFLVGWGMNSRGAVELAIAFIVFKAGLLPTKLYSALIVMALVTTLIFPFVITRMIRKEPHIMD